MKELLTERPHLFEPNIYIAMYVEIKGECCPNRVADAVCRAYQANETTMSKIVLKGGAAGYERMSVSGCTVAVVDKNWIGLVKENEKQPFAIDRGELVRSFVIPEKAGISLLIMAHHLAGDGKSILYLIKDVMSALSGRPLSFKPLTLLTEDCFAKTSLSLRAKYYARYCNRKWKHAAFTWDDYYNLHEKYWHNVSSDITYRTLSAAETGQIIETAKQIGCSVNDFLVTKLFQKVKRKCEVGIPVSIRESGDEAMANLTSGISISYRFDPKKSFAKNAMQVHNKISERIRQTRCFVLEFLSELPPTLIDAVLLSTCGCCQDRLAVQTARIMQYTGRTRDYGITNLTRLDIPVSYNEFEIEHIIFVPPAVSYARNVVGVLTVNGKMTVSFHNRNRIEGGD